MELWDLYTESGMKTGGTHIRGNPLPKDKYHLVVNVWIKNSDENYLISRRSKTKLKNPLMFETVAGAALKGENSLQAAIRETKEEVGIDLDAKTTKFVFRNVCKNLNSILDVYLFEYNGIVDLKNATTDEVESVKWMTTDEVYDLSQKGLFVHTLEYCFSKIFNLQK